METDLLSVGFQDSWSFFTSGNKDYISSNNNKLRKKKMEEKAN